VYWSDVDENKKDAINRRNGQKPKHMSKDKAQAQEGQNQEVQAQPMRSKAKY